MTAPLLHVESLTKTFAGVRALDGVSLSLAAGRVLGVVGENGAGKSTLMNILAGVVPADAGRVTWQGQPYAPRDPADAARAGVALVHQELNLFPNLSVAENLFLTDPPRRGPAGLLGIDRRRLRAQARAALDAVGRTFDPGRPLG